MKKLLFEIYTLLFVCLPCFHDLTAQPLTDYLDPPRIIKLPSPENNYLPESRQFSGIPSLAISPEGRFWTVWYAGPTPGEDLNNYIVVATSADQGSTWCEVLIIDPDGPGPVRAYDPQIWVDPHGRLWIFWAQAAAQDEGTWSLVKRGTLAGVWAIKIDDPETRDPDWDPPERLADGVMMGKPLVLSAGEMCFPVQPKKIDSLITLLVITQSRWFTKT